MHLRGGKRFEIANIVRLPIDRKETLLRVNYNFWLATELQTRSAARAEKAGNRIAGHRVVLITLPNKIATIRIQTKPSAGEIKLMMK